MTVTASPGGSIIYLEDVTVDYDGFKALNGLNFFMDYKELRVVIGPNGAGKTTLLDVISGKVQPSVGRVIFGRSTDLVGRRENEIASLGVGRKFQTPSIFANLTVRENLELALARASKGVLATLQARSGSRSTRTSARVASPTARSSGWRSAWSWSRTRSFSSWTSRWRA